MNNNILFITSSFEDETKSLTVQNNSHYPIGLAYLHSYIENCGYNVETLFLNDYQYEKCLNIIIKSIKKSSPKIIGFQMLTNNRVSSFRLIEYIHKNYPEINIVIGGIHASLMYEQILKKYPFLTAVLGEGELTFAELIPKLINKDNDFESINGIAFNKNGEIVKTKTRALIENLDILPFPKHEIFFTEDRTLGNLLTSRGCPFNCSFCCLDSISQRKVRYRSINNVIAEIEYMIQKFPEMEFLWIHDDSFFLDNQRVIEFCDEIVKRNIKLKFICSARVKPISKELIKALEKAGFVQVLFGLESGAAEILKSSHKSITKEDVVNAFKLFADSSIEVTSFLIVGLPGETIETVKETIEFIQTLQKIKYLYYEDIGVLFIYPGTEVYQIAQKAGQINDNYWLTDNCVPFYTSEHSITKLFEYKETILNHIALGRFDTFNGFVAQFKMIPYILKYVRKNKGARQFILPHFLRRQSINYLKKIVGLDRESRKKISMIFKKKVDKRLAK